MRHTHPLCPVKCALTNRAAVCQEQDPATDLKSCPGCERFLCAVKLTQALHLNVPSNVMEEAALKKESLIHGTPGDHVSCVLANTLCAHGLWARSQDYCGNLSP